MSTHDSNRWEDEEEFDWTEWTIISGMVKRFFFSELSLNQNDQWTNEAKSHSNSCPRIQIDY